MENVKLEDGIELLPICRQFNVVAPDRKMREMYFLNPKVCMFIETDWEHEYLPSAESNPQP